MVPEWQASFKAFFAVVGPLPPNRYLRKRDPDQPLGPDNWVLSDSPSHRMWRFGPELVSGKRCQALLGFTRQRLHQLIKAGHLQKRLDELYAKLNPK
jgi:hypothetical protein